jgi:hypothetical protein
MAKKASIIARIKESVMTVYYKYTNRLRKKLEKK